MENVHQVSDFSAFAPEKIEHFAKLLCKSPQRRTVFWEICRGKSKDPKTAEEIGKRVHLSYKRVLEIASPLAAHQLFEKVRHNRRIAYRKYPNINAVKQKIMDLAENKARLAGHVTLRKPGTRYTEIRFKIPRTSADLFLDVRPISIDGIRNFSRVRSLKHKMIPDKLDPPRLPEKVFKIGIANVLGNKGVFKDWGGEKNDLYTSHVNVGGTRYAAAIGLKGPATTGTLTPGKMGKNGDQIQRLFDSDAQLFLLQYEGTIAETVSQQLKGLAVNKSVEDRRTVFYGVVALEDSYRLRLKYPKEFAKAAKKMKVK
jgi:hypothetical protein